jgi:ribosome-associated protein
MLNVNEKISIPLSEFDFSYARSSGPGGQNVNKVNSKVILKWDIGRTRAIPESVKQRFCQKYKRRISRTGVLTMNSHRFRDQGRNVADVLSKLRELVLSVAEEPKVRKKKRVSRASKQRRLDTKKRLSDKKQSRRNPRLD